MAGEGDAERLVILLEARVRDFEKAMERAEKKATGSYGNMRKGSKDATRAMEQDMEGFTSRVGRLVDTASRKFDGMGTAFVGGFLGGLTAGGISAIVSRVGMVADEVARIGDEAKRSGLSVQAFQELRFVADQNRVGIDALVDGFKELSLRADEWITTGAGSAAEAFERMGFTATELRDKLRDPSKLFTEIIGKLEQLDRAAQIRIADEIFGGTGGEQFVQLIEQGEAGIAATIDRAHELGLVLDADVIAKADEVDRKFNEWANTLGFSVKSAIVEVADAMSNFLDQFGTLEQELANIEARMAEPIAAIDEYVAAGFRLAASGHIPPEVEHEIRSVAAAFKEGAISADEARAEFMRLGELDPEAWPVTNGIMGLITRMGYLADQARAVREEMAAAARDPVGRGASWEALQNEFFPKPVTRPSLGGGSRAGGISEAERQAKAIQNVIKALEFERSVLGLTEMEQDKMNRLRQAGVDASSEQGQQIVSRVEKLHAEKVAVDAATKAQKDFQQQFEAVTGAVGDAIGSLFSGPISDASQIMDRLLGGLAQIGPDTLISFFEDVGA